MPALYLADCNGVAGVQLLRTHSQYAEICRLGLGRILTFGFKYSFQICHEYSNIRYWMTSGIGLPYINIAVAESADRLARSFDVTLYKHCVNIPTKTSAAVFSAGHYTLRSCRYVRTFTHTCSCATMANGLRVCKNASRLLPSILAILCQYSTPINTGHAGSSSCSRKSADKLAANRSTTGTASPSGMVRSKLINVSSV